MFQNKWENEYENLYSPLLNTQTADHSTNSSSVPGDDFPVQERSGLQVLVVLERRQVPMFVQEKEVPQANR